MNRPEIVLVVAVADNGVMGEGGGMPWHLSADFRRVKALTMGKPMIMGRKTFDSFPAPLPGRRHIVLTNDPAWRAPGAEVAHSVTEALDLAGDGTVAVIGGAQVYALFEPLADWIELTEIHGDFDGDTTMPAPGPEWREMAREEHPAADGRPAHAFVTLRRSH